MSKTSMVQTQARYIPQELLIKIASNLHRYRDLHNFRLVSQSWAAAGHVILDDNLRRRGISTYVRKYWRPSDGISCLQKVHKFGQEYGLHRIEFLNLQISPYYGPEQGDSFLPKLYFPHLQDIILQRIRFSSNQPLASFFEAHKATLQKVGIFGCHITKQDRVGPVEHHLWSPILHLLLGYPLYYLRWSRLHVCGYSMLNCVSDQRNWRYFETSASHPGREFKAQKLSLYADAKALVKLFEKRERDALKIWIGPEKCQLCRDEVLSRSGLI